MQKTLDERDFVRKNREESTMATIAEKSRTKEIIDRLQGIINNASAVPLAPGKISVFKDEVQALLTEMATQMEIELKTYHEVNDRKGKIISEAKKEAEKIIYQAEHSASRMRVSRHTTDVPPLDYNTLNDEERSALGNANEIYGASLIYTDEMLTEVTELISDAYHNIRSDYEIILQVLEEKLDIINNNRAELMDGLQEMDTEDRSQQILEIGQLLSSELHMSRMKARMNSDEYEDGSVQLSLDLQEEQEEKARLAEEKAQQAAVALAEMTAERDALVATVEKMKKEGMKGVVRGARDAGMTAASAVTQTGMAQAEATAAPAFVKMMEEPVKQPEKEKEAEPEEEVEYEIVYVTEDELEEGEEYEIEYVDEDEIEEDVEYEIEYVNEEDLEEGEEYEVEYVDEEEEIDTENLRSSQQAEENTEENPEMKAEEGKLETVEKKPEEEKLETAEKKPEEEKPETVEKKPEKEKPKTAEKKPEKEERKLEETKIGTKDNKKQSEEVKEAIKELEEMEKENEKIPLIPHFKKSESVASVSSEKIAKMATAITTETKYNGLISRAVRQREKAEEEETVKVEKTEPVSKEPVKDEDIKTGADGKEYVQATMQFDEDFEIMEF